MKKTVQYFVLGLCPSSQISLSVLFITHALTKAVPKQGFILPKGIFGVVEERICTLVTISHRRIFSYSFTLLALIITSFTPCKSPRPTSYPFNMPRLYNAGNRTGTCL